MARPGTIFRSRRRTSVPIAGMKMVSPASATAIRISALPFDVERERLDPKERLFGLAGPKGNHGEDVKEYYYYLDNTPTHCSMRYLYKYPHAAFPYEDLYKENARRDKSDREYELIDTGIFDDNRYFDVFVEYAKAGPEDICIKITAVNRGPETAPLHLLPTVWFRNTWSWANEPKPIAFDASKDGRAAIHLEKPEMPHYTLYCDGGPGLLFCENETNPRAVQCRERVGLYKGRHRQLHCPSRPHGDRSAAAPAQKRPHITILTSARELRARSIFVSQPRRFGGQDRKGLRGGVCSPPPRSRRILRRRDTGRIV